MQPSDSLRFFRGCLLDTNGWGSQAEISQKHSKKCLLEIYDLELMIMMMMMTMTIDDDDDDDDDWWWLMMIDVLYMFIFVYIYMFIYVYGVYTWVKLGILANAVP
jgi:hypothetical protein